MHVSSGRWQFGLFLSLVTAVLWGILPIKLKEVLKVMDPSPGFAWWPPAACCSSG